MQVTVKAYQQLVKRFRSHPAFVTCRCDQMARQLTPCLDFWHGYQLLLGQYLCITDVKVNLRCIMLELRVSNIIRLCKLRRFQVAPVNTCIWRI